MYINDMDEYFERYLGRIFYNIINDNFKNEIKTVVELGPGFRYKIACALQIINFNGTLYIIDSNTEVLKYIKKKYKELLPYATIKCINCDFVDSIKYLPKKIDLLLGNHIIDDMIISKYLNNKLLKNAFNNTKLSSKLLNESWKALSKSKLLNKYKKEVLNDFKTFYKNIDVKLNILSGYKSGYYVDDKNYIEDLINDTFIILKKHIKTDNKSVSKSLDFYMKDFDVCLKDNGLHLLDNIQNSKNWIVGKYE